MIYSTRPDQGCLEGSQTSPAVKTPDFAASSRLREATSGKPGGYVGQAALTRMLLAKR